MSSMLTNFKSNMGLVELTTNATSCQSRSPESSSSEEAVRSGKSYAEEEGIHDSTSPTSASSSSSSSPIQSVVKTDTLRSDLISTGYTELYSENIVAKVLRTALAALSALPKAFPEIVPQDEGSIGCYSLREAEFWTCGFFPGMIHCILERLIRYPASVQVSDSISRQRLYSQFLDLCHQWNGPIRRMDHRTDTHDIGFIVMPALRLDWELHGNRKSLESIVSAARSLATRYVPSAKAIRSWNLLRKNDVEILGMEDNLIVIIDSLCNLDLLYYAAHHAQDRTLAEMASAHAETVLRSHLRCEPTRASSETLMYRGQWYSTCHVANIDPQTGAVKHRLTAQGYHRDSTWSRGQAWAILGYAETYAWTKDRRFLWAACGLAEYFLSRLEDAPESARRGRNVPLWDFDAPIDEEAESLRDSSAGVVAANGMLLLSQALAGEMQSSLSARFLHAALAIVKDTLDFALAPEQARLVTTPGESIAAAELLQGSRFDGILKFGTANNNADAKKRYANHGLVYGDYYLVLLGNRLLQMGLC
jgi:hypothetical protein